MEGIKDGHWRFTKDGDARAFELFTRHYSFYHYREPGHRVGRNRYLMAGPGYKVVLVDADYTALFIWRKFKDKSGQAGVNCAVFRNESKVLSSDLIVEACGIAWQRWPGERLYTYVNPRKIQSRNPGYCFKAAGWNRCGETKKRKLTILERLPDMVTTAAPGQLKPGTKERE